MDSEFRKWLRKARKGEVYVYHTGHLARDREKSVPVDQAAQEAWDAAESGKVLLTQRKVKRGYEYVATRIWRR